MRPARRSEHSSSPAFRVSPLADTGRSIVRQWVCPANRSRGGMPARSASGPAVSTGLRNLPVWLRPFLTISSGVPCGDQVAAAHARLGAQVDDPVGRLDHLEVVLDHDHRVAQVGQAMDHIEQLADVVEVQPGGRLVEDVQGLSRCRAGPARRPA